MKRSVVEHPDRPRRWRGWDYLLLVAISGASWIVFFRPLDFVTFDGTYYINQARSLFSITHPPGAFPVGYPFFIAVLLPVVHDGVLSARLVSMLASVGSVLVLYTLAVGFLRRKPAFFCAVALALTPLFIRLSLSTYSEALYIFWVLLGLLFFSRDRYLLAGLSLGISGITRPESLAVVAVLVLLRLRRLGAVLTMAVAFVAVYLINTSAFFIWRGEFDLLPKHQFFGASAENWGLREQAVGTVDGASGATRDIGRIIREYFFRWPEEIRLLARHAGFLSFIAAAWGALARSAFPLAAMLPILFYPLFTVRSDARYILPYLPIILLYAFVGCSSIEPPRLRRFAWALLALSLSVGVVINLDQARVPDDAGFRPLKTAGMALREHVDAGVRIADRKPYLAFYAGGEYAEIPVGDYDETIMSMMRDQVDLLAMHVWVAKAFRPQLWPLATDAAVVRGETRVRRAFHFGEQVLIYAMLSDAPRLSWRQLTDPPDGFDGFPAWSPDGESVAFASTRGGESDIYTIPVQGGRVRRVIDWPSRELHPAWSPDGRRVAFSSDLWGGQDIFAIDVSTGHVDTLVWGDGDDFWPVWCGDDQVVFFSDRDGKPAVWSKNLSTGSSRKLSGDDRVFPTCAGDGRRMAWIEEYEHVVLFDTGSGETVRVPAPRAVNYAPAFSPNGRYLAVTANDWGSIDIYLMASNGTNPLLLTKQPGVEAHPVWSPDGTSLAIVSDRGGTASIWILSNLEPFLARIDSPPQVVTLPDPSGR